MKEPVALSPREFAALFGKEQTWGYRQIYAGKVKTITEYGRTMIPAAEVERIVGAAAILTRGKGLLRRSGRPRRRCGCESMPLAKRQMKAERANAQLRWRDCDVRSERANMAAILDGSETSMNTGFRRETRSTVVLRSFDFLMQNHAKPCKAVGRKRGRFPE
jgi:hypothetical protein